jgi:iodotyrosine deiodinase
MTEAQISANASVPLTYREYPVAEMAQRAADFYAEMRRRRSVRHFSDRPVPREVIEECLRAAGTAPSGANMQPWHFVAVSDPAVKQQIRLAAEERERAFYARRASQAWIDALAPLGTDARKPFLETAPYLIAVFAQRYGLAADGSRIPHYYVHTSAGIATGILITALHHAGLVTLTYTPSPMGFLREILDRPPNERPLLLVVTGYPAASARVPEVGKKPLSEIATFV